jgi:hypothetical protein
MTRLNQHILPGEGQVSLAVNHLEQILGVLSAMKNQRDLLERAIGYE